ncbi:MAG: oligosaccharide flippase family protein, partial [Nitrosomonas ureae]
MQDQKPNTKSLAGSLLAGASWSIGIRWVSKFLGIISLAICARILSPEDYGLVTMAMVVVGFVSLILELGLETALIRTQDTSAELYNSAWSIRIIQRSVLALIVIVTAPLAANLYNDSRITLIMVAVGIAEFVCAFENIYSVNLRKFLNFRSDFLYIIIPRVTSFIAAVTSVIVLESYWGLVIGICVTEF